MTHHTTRQKRIRFLLIFFMSALVLSGLTAIPLQWELKVMMPLVKLGTQWGIMVPALAQWIEKINQGVQNGYGQYPFLAYGTDWLAFGHIAIAIAFIGPLRDPVTNIWVVEFGMIACALIVPWALIFGAIRGIPFFWQFVDMSFGIFGLIPLWVVYRDILHISDKV
jgi:hypothetical protein